MPIYDQYLIGTNDDYSGSYTDNIVTIFSGSSLGDRKFIGSKTNLFTDSNLLTRLNTRYSDNIYVLSSSNKGKNNQFITFNTQDEIYYDSLVASPIDYALKISPLASVVLLDNKISGSSILQIEEHNKLQSLGIIQYFYNPLDSSLLWWQGMPFEKSFKGLTKLKRISSKLDIKKEAYTKFNFDILDSQTVLTPTQYSDVNSGVIITFWKDISGNEFLSITTDLLSQDINVTNDSVFDLLTNESKDKIKNIINGYTKTNFLKPNLKESYKVFFGIFRKKQIKSLDYATNIWKMRKEYNIVVDGFKYGLYNVSPTNTNAIFRRDHYGQPRDMLEQRPLTKFFIIDDGKDTITRSPITITFVEGSDAYVTNSSDLDTADSGIYHKEYASGKPFEDRTTY